MDYERKDSMAKAKNGKEPQKLHPTLKAPKGYKDQIAEDEEKRISRREALNKYFNKIVKDRF